MKEKIKELIEKEMEKKDVEYLSGKDELIKEIYKRFCRDCQLKKECDLCNVLKEETKEKLKQKMGENNF